MTGRIIKSDNGVYTVEVGERLFLCRAASKIRKEGIMPLVGDNVIFEDSGNSVGFITSVCERRNCFIRPRVANVDVFAIIVAAAEPEPMLYNIDKLTAVAVAAGTKTAIIISKTDIAEPEYLCSIYSHCPFELLTVNKYDERSIEAVRSFLKGKTTVLAGASGVGKSSLLNALYGELHTQVGQLSKRIARGKNTTRHTELYKIDSDTYIADTPGFGLLDFKHFDFIPLEAEKLVEAFPEMSDYTDKCKFRNCTHLCEDGCAVIEAVNNSSIPFTRHESYVKLYTELKSKDKYCT